MPREATLVRLMRRLEPLQITLSDDTPAAQALTLIQNAKSLAEEMQGLPGEDRIPSLVTSNGLIAWRFLQSAAAYTQTDAPRFCEWGSGIGVVSCLAALRGWESTGVEIEPRLIEVSRQLAKSHDVNVNFRQGNYRFDRSDEANAAREFDVLGFDIIYIYAWPAERQAVTEAISRHAAPGLIFLRYGGGIQCDAFRVV